MLGRESSRIYVYLERVDSVHTSVRVEVFDQMGLLGLTTGPVTKRVFFKTLRNQLEK